MRHGWGSVAGWLVWARVGLVAGTLFFGLALMPRPGVAQDWVTPETCRVDAAEIDPAIISDEDLARWTAASAGLANRTGRFWRIESPEGQVSHLWGTMHSSHQKILNVPDTLLSVLRDARILALEYDPRPMSRLVADQMANPPEFWRSEYLMPDDRRDFDPRIRRWIEARLRSMGYQDGWLPYLTDAGLVLLLLSDPCEDFSAAPIQDFYLFTLAHVEGTPVTGLEPFDATLRALSKPDRAKTARALSQFYGAFLGPQENASAYRTAYFTLYLQGRMGELAAWQSEYVANFFGPDEGARILSLANGYLLEERNRTFVTSALPLLEGGGALLAVGAGHLPGDTGLVELFRQKGFIVTRVPLPGEAR